MHHASIYAAIAAVFFSAGLVHGAILGDLYGRYAVDAVKKQLEAEKLKVSCFTRAERLRIADDINRAKAKARYEEGGVKTDLTNHL